MITKFTKKVIAIVLMAIMLVGYVKPVEAAQTSDVSALGQLTDSYAQANDSTFTLTSDSRIFVVSDREPSGALLQTAQLIQRQFAAAKIPVGTTLAMVWGPESYANSGDMVLKVDAASGIAQEGYQLQVTDKAVVAASDVNGLLYGANMLQKCFRYAENNQLIGFTAYDAPDTVQRIVSLDCGRKYYSKEWICNFIRQMSWMGYNTIEFHFSEDGGFRLDIWDENYYTDGYQPENDFSWICGSKVQYWVYDGNKNNTSYPYSTDPDAGKYLSTKDVIEILDTAKEYHIDVIPSFDSPAHMDYLTWKFEQNYNNNKNYSFTYNGTTYKASSTKGCINYTETTGNGSPNWYYAAVDIREGTMARAFTFALYEDIADFFKVYAGSTDFSIGADEVGQGGSVKWSYTTDFPDYINDLNALLNSKGYTMRMFNDFIGTTAYSTNQSFAGNIEIMYWDSPFNPNSGGTGTPTKPASSFVNEGRTLYNCIQTHTYYVLRVANANSVSSNYKYMDARNPQNKNWTFYHSTEESIYNEWKPNNVSEKGTYSENVADIPASQLGGAYFLIWNDYAALNTEKEVWEGAVDSTGTSSNIYSLFNRMWSNIMKMWNMDINASVSYSNFAAVRDTFGYFPGYTGCSSDAYLPAASSVTQAYLADHSALTEALAAKVEQGAYTDESYAAYLTAFEAAEKVNANYGATAEEIAAAIENLKKAQKELVLESVKDGNLTIVYKTIVNGEEKVIKTVTKEVASIYVTYIEPLTGYTFEQAEGGIFVQLPSKDGSGFLAGKAPREVTLMYTNMPSTARLNELVKEAETEQGSYTQESWSKYQDVLTNAKNYVVSESTMQSDIDTLVQALEAARNALVTASEKTTIIEVKKLTETARLGKSVGLLITTTPDVSSIGIVGKEITRTTAKVQTLSEVGTVKVWYVTFPADTEGTFTYTIQAGMAAKEVEITVR